MTQSTAAKPENTVIAVLAAIYMTLLAIFSFCGSLAVVGLGSLAGGLFSQLGSATTDASASAALSEAASASGFLTIIGIVTLILSIAMLVVAIGVFMKKPWAYQGTLGVNGLYIALVVLGIIAGGGLNIVSVVLAIISGVIIYLFMTHGDTKAVFGK